MAARRSPGDPGAIGWIRDHTPGDAVVLEAFGDDYSAFGHARISTFTGRPTVIGWAGHELQWDHDAGSRINDIKTLYTTPDAAVARPLLARYGVRYVVVGPIEHTTYGDARRRQVGAARQASRSRRRARRSTRSAEALARTRPA